MKYIGSFSFSQVIFVERLANKLFGEEYFSPLLILSQEWNEFFLTLSERRMSLSVR
jgi:hypothetical protein